MEDTKKISMFQFICLITVSEIMHQYTYLPILSTVPNNQDSWVALLLFIPYAIILCLPIMFLLNKFKNITFFDLMKLILGKMGAKIVIFIICIFFSFCNIACLVLSIIFLRDYILFSTPVTAIAIAILIPAAYISLKGISAMGRLSIFVFLCIVVTIILFFIFGFNMLDFQSLKPVMGDSSFFQVNLGGFITAARVSDILVLLVAAYRLNDEKKINKVFFISIAFYIGLVLLMLIPVITLLGIDYGLQAFNPYYVFARQVKFYSFLERAEVFAVISWLSGAILKISLYHYLLSYYLSKVFGIKSYKSLVLPVVLFTLSVIVITGLDKSNLINTIRSDAVFPWIVLFFTFVIPIIILLIYLIRRKKVNKKYSMLQ
jgi:spore germination protein KB